MSTWLKLGVFGELHNLAAEGLRRVDRLYAAEKKELYITSIREGTHGPGSLHPMGFAWDQRQNGVEIEKIKKTLGNNFQVIMEADHIHIEFDPH